MSNLVKMTNAIQRLLMEEELKDISSQVRNGDVLKLILSQGGEYFFEIQGGAGGNFIIKDINNEKRFTFDKDDFVNDTLTVYPYTGGIDKGEGTDYKISLMTIDVSGKTYEIEPIYNRNEPDNQEPDNQEPDNQEPENGDEDKEQLTPEKEQELEASKNDFNARIGEIKADNVLFINTGAELEDETFEEHVELEFVVVNTSKDYVQINLANANGKKSKFYYERLNNKQVFISKNNPIKIEDSSLILPIYYESKGETKGIRITNITSVSDNVKNPTNKNKEMAKGLSKKSTVDYINKYHDDIWSKQPDLLDTIKRASPTGLYQIGQILNKSKLRDSYLKKGMKVRFIVIDGKEITGVYNNTTLRLNPNEKRGYEGTIYRDKVIKSGGNSDKVHWEIELLEELNDNVYKVKYYFCTKADKCTVKQLGSIKIININN